jgi:hypothetical protein
MDASMKREALVDEKNIPIATTTATPPVTTTTLPPGAGSPPANKSPDAAGGAMGIVPGGITINGGPIGLAQPAPQSAVPNAEALSGSGTTTAAHSSQGSMQITAATAAALATGASPAGGAGLPPGVVTDANGHASAPANGHGNGNGNGNGAAVALPGTAAT